MQLLVTVQWSVVGDAPFDKLRVTVSDTLRVCHGELCRIHDSKAPRFTEGLQLLHTEWFLNGDIIQKRKVFQRMERD